MYVCQLIGAFMLCYHALLTKYVVTGGTGGVQWVVYIKIRQRMTSKSAQNCHF